MTTVRASNMLPKTVRSGVDNEDFAIDELFTIYETNHNFPNEYRPLIWRFLLKTPENIESFAALMKLGIHQAFLNLPQKYPLKSRTTSYKMQMICSMLAHCSTTFAEMAYLPQLVYPFILIYKHNDLASFETVLTILMWWGYSWNLSSSIAPGSLTSAINDIFEYNDKELFNHFRKYQSSPGDLSWRILSTFFTEICSQESWLQLVDFIFLNFSDPRIMLFIPTAIICYYRNILLSVKGENCHLPILSCFILTEGLLIRSTFRFHKFFYEPPDFGYAKNNTIAKDIIVCHSSGSLLSFPKLLSVISIRSLLKSCLSPTRR